MAYGDEPAFNLQQVGNWIKGIAESSKRPGTKPRWGGESGGSTSTRTPASSSKPTSEPNKNEISDRRTHGGTRYFQQYGRDVYAGPGGVYDLATGQRVFQKKTEEGMKYGSYDGAYSALKGPYVGTNLRTVDGEVLESGTNVWKVPDSTKSDNGDASNSGRGDKRTNAAGVAQTGTNMSRSFNDLLAGVGQKPFSSNQLPGTDTNPFSATSAKTPGFDMSQGDFGGAAAVNFDAEGGVAAIRSKNLQDDQPFNPSAPQIAGGSERISQQATGISSGRLSDALEGVKTQEANREMTDERRQLMARAAFLDGKDSMSGLRAKEAVNGVVYAGGKHYVAGKSGDDPAVKISRDQARSIANNEDTASNISSSELKAQELLKKKSTEIVAATKQSPTVLEETAKTQAFTQDKPQYGSSTPEFGGKIEFEDSNPGSRPGFGNTGGFKSGIKRIDTSMTNPFG